MILQEWAYEPLNKLYRAVQESFHKQMFPTRRSLYFVSEPEACALFTVQSLVSTNENSLIPVSIPSGRSLTHAEYPLEVTNADLLTLPVG